MSTRRRFTEEFKLEAVKQVVDRGFGVADISKRWGVSAHSLYRWIHKYGIPAEQRLVQDDQAANSKDWRKAGHWRARYPKKGRRVLSRLILLL